MRKPALRQQLDVSWNSVFGDFSRDGQPLNIQIRRMIVHAVETGTLPANMRLPPSRNLAATLRIGRNTVTSAYQQLIDEGILVARKRTGIFVADIAPKPEPATRSVGEEKVWQERFVLQPSSLRQHSKPRDWQSYPYPFLFGQYDPELFPTNNWREAVRATSSVQEIQGWAGDMIDDDDPDLIEQLRVQVLPRRGIFAAHGEVIITVGSQQALSMLVELLVGPDTPAAVENPGYPDMRNMVALATRNLRFLNHDGDGVVPDEAFAAAKVAFVTPGHHCPTTIVTPIERRRAILEAAERQDVLIVEDDYDADLSIQEDGNLPSLKSLDRTGRVLYVGSFSKVVAPGLRIGYIVAPKPVISELRVLRRIMLRHPPTNNQRTLATFIALGHYRQHLNKAGAAMLERSTLIEQLLPKYLPNCAITRGRGATSLWVEGPPSMDARRLVELARRKGVLVEAGDIFFSDPALGRNFFRLGFSSIPAHRIEAGLIRLAEAIRECG